MVIERGVSPVVAVAGRREGFAPPTLRSAGTAPAPAPIVDGVVPATPPQPANTEKRSGVNARTTFVGECIFGRHVRIGEITESVAFLRSQEASSTQTRFESSEVTRERVTIKHHDR